MIKIYYGAFSSLVKEYRKSNIPDFDVYIKNDSDKEVFHFPVNPIENLTINRSKNFETIDLLNFGEADFTLKGEKIKEITFSTLLPNRPDSFCRYLEINTPSNIIKNLEKWMNQKEPIRLIITRLGFNDLVIISDLSEEIRAGESDDKYISITCRVYKEPLIEAIKNSKTTTNKVQSLRNNRSCVKKNNSKGYIVKSGDTLYKIAKCKLGSGSKWKTIYNKNKKIIGKNPNLIKPGMRLVI